MKPCSQYYKPLTDASLTLYHHHVQVPCDQKEASASLTDDTAVCQRLKLVPASQRTATELPLQVYTEFPEAFLSSSHMQAAFPAFKTDLFMFPCFAMFLLIVSSVNSVFGLSINIRKYEKTNAITNYSIIHSAIRAQHGRVFFLRPEGKHFLLGTK
jgi:hypothetical protein